MHLRDLDVRSLYLNVVDPITLPKSVIMDANCFMLQEDHKNHGKMQACNFTMGKERKSQIERVY